MPPVDATRPEPEEFQGHPPIQCEECESALQSHEGHSVSFLLLDQLTIPVIGCGDHVDQFVSICEFTSTGEAEVIDHPPAGGVNCPSCQFAPYNMQQPVIPIQDGAVGVLACPEHQTELINRYQTGLDTKEQLTSSLDTSL